MGEWAAAVHGDARGGKRLKPKGMLAEALHSVLAWILLQIQLFHFIIAIVVLALYHRGVVVPAAVVGYLGLRTRRGRQIYGAFAGALVGLLDVGNYNIEGTPRRYGQHWTDHLTWGQIIHAALAGFLNGWQYPALIQLIPPVRIAFDLSLRNAIESTAPTNVRGASSV